MIALPLLFALSFPRWIVYPATGALDMTTTEIARAHGAREGNPLLTNRAIAYPVKAATVYGLGRIDAKLTRDHSSVRHVLRVGVCVWYGYWIQHAVRINEKGKIR